MFSKSSLTQRRSSYDITADILRIARKGARKTRIVYGANLNFKILEEYLAKLEKAGLLSLTEGQIKTTSKGREFLDQFRNLREFCFK